ncbi:MAG: DUF4956 domain-containing protein [Elusimicrobiota bacterium]
MNNLFSFAEDPLALSTIFLNLFVGLILSLMLKYHFERFSSTLSGKKELSRILPFLILIVCLIISVVKSSLALSLGLVGALSIVRFRTPIKEPEELIYLFMAIAIGLGLGANQTILTSSAAIFILIVVAVFKWKFNKSDSKDLYVSVHWDRKEKQVSAEEISGIIADFSETCDLKRLDHTDTSTHIMYMINVDDSHKIFRLVEHLKDKYPHLQVSFIDQSRIPGV